MREIPAVGSLRELTELMARGDDEAWRRFHRDFGPRIFQQLLGATKGDHALASEALQQTYLRIARHVKPCELEPMFQSWLRTVAQSALHDCWRRRSGFWRMLRRRRDLVVDETSSVEMEERVLAQLDRALASLDPTSRKLLEEKYYAGRDVRDLANSRAISPKALESRLTRARTQLRHAFQKILVDEQET
jgi:RNA polymerase sigma factor (sigma-70 family)